MAWPWIFEATFEAGNASEFSPGLNDPRGRIGFPWMHQNRHGVLPRLGTHCMEATLEGRGRVDGYIDTNQFNFSSGSRYFNVPFRLSEDFYLPEGHSFTFLRLMNSGDPVDVGISARTGEFSAQVPRAGWMDLAGRFTVGSSGSMFLETWDSKNLLAPLNISSITGFRLGVMRLTTAAARGSIFFDSVIIDNTRLAPQQGQRDVLDLSGRMVIAAKTGMLFYGPGEVRSIEIFDNPGSAVLDVYDTAHGDFGEHELVYQLGNEAPRERATPHGHTFMRGCYLRFTGSVARAQIRFGTVGPSVQTGFSPPQPVRIVGEAAA